MYDDNSIFSPYSLVSPYWIIVEGGPLEALLSMNASPLYKKPNLMGFQVQDDWVKAWEKLMAQFPVEPMTGMNIRATVIPAEPLPSLQEIELSLKPLAETQSIAQHIWLAKYLSEGRLVAFFQPVVDREKNITGYEAFARIDAPDGRLITGGEIMLASRALRLEYQVDRLMHKQAVQQFVTQQLGGTVFINFLTNFIHLPQNYLSGLSEAIERYNLAPQAISLDIPLSNYEKDPAKLKSIAQYCQQQRVMLSLDDVDHTTGLADLLAGIKPTYIKLDASLSSTITTQATQTIAQEIITRAHAFGAKVIAQAVETVEQFAAYQALQADYFQGYHFGAPTRRPPTSL